MFYKKAYEEISKEDKSKSVQTKHLNQEAEVDALATDALSLQPARTKRLTSRATSSTSGSTSTCNCNQKSSRDLTKMSAKLLIENKKLMLKNNDQSATILLLKKKNKSLENFKEKIIKKKEKLSRDADELERLAESVKIKNKDMYTAEVLAKLDLFSK